MNLRALSRQQTGFTIVEFMIAGVLGLVVLIGVLQIFLGSRQTFTLQGAIADVQDSGRFALQFLTEDIQRAGWSINNVPIPEHILLLGDKSAGTASNCSSANGAQSDCIKIRYESRIDCLGQAVSTVAENRYFVNYAAKPDADGVLLGELSCLGNGNATPQPLLRNVESFQVRYGLDSNGDDVVDRYVAASDLTTATAVGVMAVRIGLVLVSDANALDKPRDYAATDLFLFDVADGYERKNDRRLRRVYVKTIAIPNR